jgi:predicted transcriptional regulator of viral defense system|tara:strand:- start:3112 stop:3372 length:261 start_codon:yes stop_codon:yes gene_type:complete
MKMSESELLAELQAAIDNVETPDDAFTTNELADLLEVGEAAVRKRLKRISKTGRLIPVRIMRKSLTGNLRKVWGYRILPEKKDGEE